MGSLDGIKVVDLSSTFLGPYCTMLLAQMGADVIKIEPLGGDVVRKVGPARHQGMSATFMAINGGKRSIAVDLHTPAGSAILDGLVETADVVVHNMRAEAAERLGITFASMGKKNPRLVVAGAYGFGADSPQAGRPAYDDVIQAASGAAWLEGVRHGEPQYVTSLLADKTCGLVLLYAVLAALLERERTGRGQGVQVPMFESMVGYIMPEQMSGGMFVPPLGSSTYDRTTSKFRKPYRTSDGYIGAVMYTDTHWRSFFESVGKPELFEDPRFRDISARTRNVDELYALVEGEIAKDSTETWMKRFWEMDCPAAEVKSIDDLLADPYLAESGILREVEHPTEGRIRTVGMPVGFSNHPRGERRERPAPNLGEHTIEVLEEIGLAPEEVDELFASNVVRAPGV